MNITNSLIFIPKDAIYVKKSMISDIGSSLTPQSPLLRNVNKRKTNPNPSNMIDMAETPKSNGEQRYIINKTGNLIILTLNSRDENGKPVQTEFRIESYIDKYRLTEDQLRSAELLALYKNGFIYDSDEIPKIRESENVKTSKKSAKQRMKQVEVEINGRTKIMDVPDDEEGSLLDDDEDYDNLDNTPGLGEMMKSARNSADGPIDDLIPKRSISGSGNIRRK